MHPNLISLNLSDVFDPDLRDDLVKYNNIKLYINTLVLSPSVPPLEPPPQ